MFSDVSGLEDTPCVVPDIRQHGKFENRQTKVAEVAEEDEEEEAEVVVE